VFVTLPVVELAGADIEHLPLKISASRRNRVTPGSHHSSDLRNESVWLTGWPRRCQRGFEPARGGRKISPVFSAGPGGTSAESSPAGATRRNPAPRAPTNGTCAESSRVEGGSCGCRSRWPAGGVVPERGRGESRAADLPCPTTRA